MATAIWNSAASRIAAYIRKNNASIRRGYVLIPCPDGAAVVAWLFGNDDYMGDTHVRQDLEGVRAQLADTGVEELGFGLNPAGDTWVLAAKVDLRRYSTLPASVFQLEMLKATLTDAVGGDDQAQLESPQGQAIWSLESADAQLHRQAECGFPFELGDHFPHRQTGS